MITMNKLDFLTPKEIGGLIAQNARKARKQNKLTLKALSEKSGVPYGTIKRFEHTGEISLSSLLKIAFVLDCSAPFEKLFVTEEILSIEDIINGKV